MLCIEPPYQTIMMLDLSAALAHMQYSPMRAKEGEEELRLGKVGRKTRNSSVRDIKVYTCDLPEKKKN